MPAHAAYRLLPENVSIISKHTPRRLTCTVLSLSSSLPPPAATIVEIPQFFSHAVWQSAQTFASSLLVSFLQMFSILVIRLLIPCQDVLSTIRVVKGNSIPYHIVKLEACHWFSYLFFALVIQNQVFWTIKCVVVENKSAEIHFTDVIQEKNLSFLDFWFIFDKLQNIVKYVEINIVFRQTIG